jgi:SAM-dependent MidA family methyltransferase
MLKRLYLPSRDINMTNNTINISDQIFQEIKLLCEKQNGIIFSHFMQLVLYHPQWGYYCNGKTILGQGGDFITAPGISKAFSRALAKQISEIQHNIKNHCHILELGAGLGQMAANIMESLYHADTKIEKYYILEISPLLIQKQQETIQAICPGCLNKFIWIKDIAELPSSFNGVILGNEFLDALPVELFKIGPDQSILKAQVCIKDDRLTLNFQPTQDQAFIQAVQAEINLLDAPLPEGYVSEINLNTKAWIKKLSSTLTQGVMLWIDYGFTRYEYYLAERSQGTLMCHDRHKTHSDYFHNLGGQDVTAHINFSQLNQEAMAFGLETLGFSNQAAFLLALNILGQDNTQDLSQQTLNSQELQTLLQPHEMGELFKVIAFGKKYEYPLLGFSLKDYSYKL